MDAVRNPYSPGAGRPPAALVGRDRELASWSVALRRVEEGRGAQPVVLYGLRGVGKTVLLARFARLAEDRDWIVAQIEAGSGKSLRAALGEALYGPLSDLVKPTAGDRLKKALKTALSFKASYDASGSWSFGLDLASASGGGADSGTLDADLAKLVRDLSAMAAEAGGGIAILVDEAQDLTNEELTALAATAHAAGQQQWPFMLALAGLPSLPRVLAEAKSYSERLFAFERIQQLAEELAQEALVQPARSEGVTWDTAAVRHVVNEAEGYPYFLQQFGQGAWNAADGPAITLADAKLGAAIGRNALDAGFFRARWDRATKSEKRYLRAMAADGDAGSPSGEVAFRLGRAINSLGPTRANLIAKGLVYAPDHGIVAFTVPGMARFIHEQVEA